MSECCDCDEDYAALLTAAENRIGGLTGVYGLQARELARELVRQMEWAMQYEYKRIISRDAGTPAPGPLTLAPVDWRP